MTPQVVVLGKKHFCLRYSSVVLLQPHIRLGELSKPARARYGNDYDPQLEGTLRPWLPPHGQPQ